ncbi:DNA repair protein RecO [Pedobacter sp. P351]|uniref:DNA repair protein RecO n=1 Tax=Pedobacter superstes TaxID=3133441 RepID=UPI00309B5937
MLHKIRGIVLKTTDYSESSVVVQVFTDKFGLQSYLINGVKKPKSKIKLNMLQPLHLLEMVVYNKPNGSLQRVSELRNQPVLQSIPYNVIKSCLTMFIDEVLYKSLKQHYEDEPLFNYIYNAVELLDRTEEGLANFHLFFLLRLTKYLGFYPDRTLESGAKFFDLKEGGYSQSQPLHRFIIDENLISDFSELIGSTFEKLPFLNLKSQNRKALLSKILDYYALHIEGFGEVKSHLILEEVLN